MTIYEIMKKRTKDNRGFTLGELLIVVAIIGILVAISIPVFSAQVKKAQRAVSEANLRSIYSELVADYIDDEKYDIEIQGDKDGTHREAHIILYHKDTGVKETFIIYNMENGSFYNATEDGNAPSFYVTFTDELTPYKRTYPGTSDNSYDPADDEEDPPEDDPDEE